MAFSFFTKSSDASKGGDTLSVVIAVESGLVRGSLVLFSHPHSSDLISQDDSNIRPRVLHTTSSDILARDDDKDAKNSAGGVKLLSAMLGSVSRVVDDVSKVGLKISAAAGISAPISKIHVVFSSPWIISKTKTVKISYEKETEITKSMINAILDGERGDLEKQFSAEEDKNLEFDLAFIEQKIFEVKLNGYPTAHFEGKKARELETSFAVSISSKSILSHIQKTIEQSIRTAKQNIECHSSLLLQYSALRNIVIGSHDYLAIHVHNEISDIIIVKKGICAGMASFPQGTALLARMSGAALGQLKEVANSSLNLQSKNAFHKTENNRITAVADSTLTGWSEQFIRTLALFGPATTMPHHVYLLANEHYAHFERAVEGIGAYKFEVTSIEKSTLDAAIVHEKKEREDPLMSLYVFALR